MNKLFLALSFFFFLFSIKTHAQLSGCTDPLASNYNASATINNGSCVYNAASISPASSWNLVSTLSETSGIVFWNNFIWTHNDNTDVNIYTLDTINGNIAQTYPLNGVANIDWEEISQDMNYLYIGDFGNNSNGNRTNLKILRIDKSMLLLNTPLIDTINFLYSNQTDFTPTGANNTDFDCEAFIVSSDSIFLFTKQWVSNNTSVYSLPKTPGTYMASLKSTYNISGLITGATYLESKNLIVLCGYSSLLQPFSFLLYDFEGYNFFGGNKRKISVSLPFHQIEGITTRDGLKYFMSNEYFTQPPFITVQQKLHIFNLSTYLSNYLDNIPVSINDTHTVDLISIFPNPAKDIISVRLNKNITEKNYTITDEAGKLILSGQLGSDTSNINVGELKSGTYLLKVGQHNICKWIKE